MTRTLNHRLDAISPSPIRQFNDKIASVDGLMKFTLGEPDFATPEHIRRAAIDGITHQPNGYTHSRGTFDLRQQTANYLERHYDLTYNPETELIITHGATQALYNSLFTLVNPGDKVLVAAPHYPIYLSQIRLVGGEPVVVDVSQDGFLWTPEHLDRVLHENPDIRVVLLNYPSNPTGKTYTPVEVEALAEVIAQHDVWIISDEIYAELTYDQPHVSIAKYVRDQTILINGASKSHSMTGWRIGVVAGPESVMSRLFIVHQGTINTPTTQSQFAAVEAFSEAGDASVDQMKGAYQERRDYLVQALEELGYSFIMPEGAFYLFVRVPDWYDGDDQAFCLDLAHKAKIGVIPGQCFGANGTHYFRISYAASMDNLQELICRLASFQQ